MISMPLILRLMIEYVFRVSTDLALTLWHNIAVAAAANLGGCLPQGTSFRSTLSHSRLCPAGQGCAMPSTSLLAS
jgi:hypothetical protein